MFELMKIVGLSAVLSAGFVTVSEMQGSPGSEPTGTKIYSDRVPEGEPGPRALRVTYAATSPDERQGAQTAVETKGDLLRRAPRTCAAQAWPNIAPDCLMAVDGTPVRHRVRTITVEQREGVNTSVLVRLPAPEMASR